MDDGIADADRIERLDHIGWRLWNAASMWKARFAEGMIGRGHDWYAEARSSIVPYIEIGGTNQSTIAKRIGLSKQAVQQLVDDLENEGVVERAPDPVDRRAKIIRFTPKGIAALRDAENVKRSVEAELKEKIGDENFKKLSYLLKIVADD